MLLVDLLEDAGPHGGIASKDLPAPKRHDATMRRRRRAPARSGLEGVAELGAELRQPQGRAGLPSSLRAARFLYGDAAPARQARRRRPLLHSSGIDSRRLLSVAVVLRDEALASPLQSSAQHCARADRPLALAMAPLDVPARPPGMPRGRRRHSPNESTD